MNAKKEFPSSYSSRRREGMQEIRFWVDVQHRPKIFAALRELINNVDHQALVLGLLELRLVLEQEAAEKQKAA
ncbi:MAG: hypothetical protein JNK19_03795 [Tabrizicola sp.]|nr:hypothetical protein [Tabrizicola sp.]